MARTRSPTSADQIEDPGPEWDSEDMSTASDESPETMAAWSVRVPGPLESGPLELLRKPVPRPGAGELLVRVDVWGVCRTDLHVAEGALPIRRSGVTPGHEVVG